MSEHKEPTEQQKAMLTTAALHITAAILGVLAVSRELGEDHGGREAFLGTCAELYDEVAQDAAL